METNHVSLLFFVHSAIMMSLELRPIFPLSRNFRFIVDLLLWNFSCSVYWWILCSIVNVCWWLIGRQSRPCYLLYGLRCIHHLYSFFEALAPPMQWFLLCCMRPCTFVTQGYLPYLASCPKIMLYLAVAAILGILLKGFQCLFYFLCWCVSWDQQQICNQGQIGGIATFLQHFHALAKCRRIVVIYLVDWNHYQVMHGLLALVWDSSDDAIVVQRLKFKLQQVSTIAGYCCEGIK